MRILFLLDDFPPITLTGASVVTYNLAQAMIKEGHQIFVITSVQSRKDEGWDQYNGIEIFRIYSNYHYRWHAYLSLLNPWVISKVKKALREIKPDVCHFHHIHRYLSYYCFKIAKKNCPAVFLTAHDAMLFNYGKLYPKDGSCIYKISLKDHLRGAGKRYNPFRNVIIRHYLKYVDKIFSISNVLENSLKANGIKNTVTMHNGIDAASWTADEKLLEELKNCYNLKGKKVILFGGRLSGTKGGEVILKSMSDVLKKESAAILLVVGKKDLYAEKMISLASELGITDKVIFTGWVDRDCIKNLFYLAELCVTPSIYCDPFNLFNIEAAAAKKPVVGTCFGGTAEIIIDGVTGYIVNPLNTRLMADKIIDLLNNSEKAKSFGEAAYQRILTTFSLDGQVEQTLIWYKKFVKI